MPWRGRWIAAFAGVLFFADLLFWQYAIDAVGAGLATVLANLQVVFRGHCRVAALRGSGRPRAPSLPCPSCCWASR
jgi:hypothetical protein